MPKNLEQTMTREVIERMAEGDETTKLDEVIKEVVRKKEHKVRPEGRSYFFRQVKKKFFSWLDTNKDEWRLFPEKARAYLKIPKPTPPATMETTPIAKPAKPTAMPVEQVPLF